MPAACPAQLKLLDLLKLVNAFAENQKHKSERNKIVFSRKIRTDKSFRMGVRSILRPRAQNILCMVLALSAVVHSCHQYLWFLSLVSWCGLHFHFLLALLFQLPFSAYYGAS